MQLASLPDAVRGFGHVRQRSLEVARQREADLLARLRNEVATPAAA